MARGGLGKGLGSLIPGGEGAKAAKPVASKASSEEKKVEIKEVVKEVVKEVKVQEPLYVKLRDLDPNKNQPRKDFDEAALQELSESIKLHGIIQPLVVKKTGKRYLIIAGERRFRAAKLAGLKEVPVVLKDYTEQEVTEIALIENIQRENLNPVEEARAYRQLVDEFGLKQEEVAGKVSKSRASVANSMRLLKLRAEVLDMVADGRLSTGHGKVLLEIVDPDLQLQAAEKIAKENLSVRQTEKLVKDLTSPKKEGSEKAALTNEQAYGQLQDRLCEKLGTKVFVRRKSENTGKIEIDYYSFEELERILETIGTYQG